LREKRGGYRGVCTKLTKETEEIIHADEIDYDRCEVIIRSLLEEKSKILTDIDEEILGICEIASIENEIEESADVMGRILSAKRKLDKVIETRSEENGKYEGLNGDNSTRKCKYCDDKQRKFERSYDPHHPRERCYESRER
jgi:hypothetical protein